MANIIKKTINNLDELKDNALDKIEFDDVIKEKAEPLPETEIAPKVEDTKPAPEPVPEKKEEKITHILFDDEPLDEAPVELDLPQPQPKAEPVPENTTVVPHDEPKPYVKVYQNPFSSVSDPRQGQ